MGKKLIIRGADFSANAVASIERGYVFGLTDEELSNASVSTLNIGGYKIYTPGTCLKYNNFIGRITSVRAYISNIASPALTLYKYNLTTSEITEITKIYFNELGLHEIVLDTPIVIEDGFALAFNTASNSQIKFRESGQAQYGAGFLFKFKESDKESEFKTAVASIDFGYEKDI